MTNPNYAEVAKVILEAIGGKDNVCLLYTSPSPRDP